MRLLLISNASYLPPRGGSTRSNLAYLHALADRGHECRVISGAAEAVTPEQQARVREELEEQQFDPSFAARLGRDAEISGRIGQIEIVAVRDFLRNAPRIADYVMEWRPDWVLISSEDLSHTLLRHSAKAAPGRIVYLAHTPQWFPFGPASWNPDKDAAAVVRSSAGIVVISRAMAEYVERHLGRKPVLVHPAIYGSGPWPTLSRFEGAIGIINPCAVKGIGTFLALADLLPDRKFAALPGWGTTRQDVENLKRRKNISVEPRVRDIAQFLQQLSLLLMPSLWLEGFGLIVMEALLRGVPVIASNSGGLREAKAGTHFVIPVRVVEKYEPVYDDRNMPRPVLPPQSVDPWIIAIHELTKSRESYDDEVRRGREAAMRFIESIDRFALERMLRELPEPPPLPTGKIKPILSQLSDAKRELLVKRLRERAGEKR